MFLPRLYLVHLLFMPTMTMLRLLHMLIMPAMARLSTVMLRLPMDMVPLLSKEMLISRLWNPWRPWIWQRLQVQWTPQPRHSWTLHWIRKQIRVQGGLPLRVRGDAELLSRQGLLPGVWLGEADDQAASQVQLQPRIRPPHPRPLQEGDQDSEALKVTN